MAVESSNQGYIDSQTYANDPAGNEVPDQEHQEYGIGQKSYMLEQLGEVAGLNVGTLLPGDLGSGIHIKTADSGAASVNANADELVIEGSGASGMTILSGASDSGNIFFGDSGGSIQGQFTYSHGTNSFVFTVDSNEQFTIDSSGRVGIKNAPDLGTGLHIKTADSGASSVSADADEAVIEGSENAGITILSGPTSVASIHFGDVDASNVGKIEYIHSLEAVRLTANTNKYVDVDSAGHFDPGVTESQDLGSVSTEWNNLYVQNAPTVSDERKKESVQPIAYGTSLLKALNPIQYVYKDTVTTDADGNEITIPHSRPHTGFIAQEVKDAMTSIGLGDWAGYALEDHPDYDGGLHTLRLNEFIGVLVAGFKELEARVAALETV